MNAHPLIKWVGSKTSVLPDLLPLFPQRIRTYYEPFFGGGAVFFALNGRFNDAVINDWNDELVNLYRMVRSFPNQLIDALANCREVYDIDGAGTFQLWRAKDPADLTDIERAVRTVFLTKTSFNGLYRVNKKGKFNAPWGKYVNPLICDPPNILAASAALQAVTFRQGDFAPAVVDAQPGDVVYFDPPYLPLTDTADFSNYTAEGFTVEDHYRLRDTFAELVSRGVTCILSNHDVPLMHEMFAQFEIRPIQVRRSINSKGDKRGGVGEVLVIGRPDPKLVPVEFQWSAEVLTGVFCEALEGL
jgi:DNA adenine methylase